MDRNEDEASYGIFLFFQTEDFEDENYLVGLKNVHLINFTMSVK